MNQYTGWQYLLIDVANNYGLDKKLFEERIQWAEDNLSHLEQLVDQVKPKARAMYMKSVMAIRDAQAGRPSGHLVEFDAVCSGLQVMSVLTGCEAGARATGLIDPHVRADAYTTLNKVMQELLVTGLQVDRDDSKNAYMTFLYGSRAEPKALFGEDTPELAAFYEAAKRIGPGAYDLLYTLLASWNPYALFHAWKLPDGFDARVKVMEKKEVRIEVDELDHATFTYEFYVNEGQKKGLSNAANVVHSVDGYVLRCMHRRCNYDVAMVNEAAELLYEAKEEYGHGANPVPEYADIKTAYYIEQYKRSGMADVVILPYLDACSVQALEEQHIDALLVIVRSMLVHKPFPSVTIHDAFKCHANNMNHLRQHYINIMAELAESNVLSDLLSQVYGTPGSFPKLSSNLGQLIRGSNYALS